MILASNEQLQQELEYTLQNPDCHSWWISKMQSFAHGPGDWGSIPGRVIPKTQKMVLDATWVSTQHHKGKVEQSCECSSAFPYTLV